MAAGGGLLEGVGLLVGMEHGCWRGGAASDGCWREWAASGHGGWLLEGVGLLAYMASGGG